MRSTLRLFSLGIATLLGPFTLNIPPAQAQDGTIRILAACKKLVFDGLRPIGEVRIDRFLGKVGEPAARCRGGQKAFARRGVPWVDWANYWGTGDNKSKTNQSDLLRNFQVDLPQGLEHVARCDVVQREHGYRPVVRFAPLPRKLESIFVGLNRKVQFGFQAR